MPKLERLAEAVRAPDSVTINGQLDEWAAAQPLLINSSEQIVRGAAAWPVFLSQGLHTLLISYTGLQPDRQAVVDAFLIIPAVACKHLENDEGHLLTVCHDMQTAVTTWEE